MAAPKKTGPEGSGQAAALPAFRDPSFELHCVAEKLGALAFTAYVCEEESFQRMAEEHRRTIMGVLHRLALKMPRLADEMSTDPRYSEVCCTEARSHVDELVALTANVSGDRFEDFNCFAHWIQDGALWLVSDVARDLSKLLISEEG